MPLYDFQCGSCGQATESRESFSTALIACPACGGEAGRKFDPASVQIRIPAAFRLSRDWALPPKDSPKWEGMDREGRTRAQAPPQTFRQYIDENGLIP